MTNAQRILVGKPEEKRTLKRPTHRCECNIKINLGETKLDGVNCIESGSGQGPMMEHCEHSNKPSGSTAAGEYLDYYHQLLKQDTTHGTS
jgi:hypothetical protein